MKNDIERTLAAVDPARAIDLGSVPDHAARELLREVLAQPARSHPRRRRSPRRRLIAISVAGVVAAVVAAGIIAGSPGGAHDTTRPTQSTTAGHHHAGSDRDERVRLVAYTGAQLQGFVVHQIPEGWYLQGSNTFRLTLAPRGNTTSPDNFTGKLVVMLLSSDAPQTLPKGDPVKVGEHDGVITHGDVDTLTYRDDAGHFVQIEAWRDALGWTDRQLASFAENVQVTAQAQPGVG